VQLKKFNGQPVVNLRHLIALVNESRQPYMRFDLEYDVRLQPARPKDLNDDVAPRPSPCSGCQLLCSIASRDTQLEP
jgi:hypothetical protein